MALDVDWEVRGLLIDGGREDVNGHAEEANLCIFSDQTSTRVLGCGLPGLPPVSDLRQEHDVLCCEVLSRGVLQQGFRVDKQCTLQSTDGVQPTNGRIDLVEELASGAFGLMLTFSAMKDADHSVVSELLKELALLSIDIRCS